jgi:uncharacterized membrane protein YecN with MAPEG domain
MHVLSLYAALFALFFVVLSVRTLRLRRKLRIAIGDSGSETMLRAMPVHSNFAEYVPLSLLLILLVETQGAQPLLVHGLCLCLFVGRLCHAFGVSQLRENYGYRVVGMALTFSTLVTSAAYLLFVYAR